MTAAYDPHHDWTLEDDTDEECPAGCDCYGCHFDHEDEA